MFIVHTCEIVNSVIMQDSVHFLVKHNILSFRQKKIMTWDQKTFLGQVLVEPTGEAPRRWSGPKGATRNTGYHATTSTPTRGRVKKHRLCPLSFDKRFTLIEPRWWEGKWPKQYIYRETHQNISWNMQKMIFRLRKKPFSPIFATLHHTKILWQFLFNFLWIFGTNLDWCKPAKVAFHIFSPWRT